MCLRENVERAAEKKERTNAQFFLKFLYYPI